MAENEGKSILTVLWTPLLAVVAAVAGLSALLPSRSSRPPAPNDTAPNFEANKVSARLWQDPLSVAREAARATKPPAATAAQPGHEGTPAAEPGAAGLASFDLRGVAEKISQFVGRDGKYVALVVCEPNSPYAEDVERRLRDRAGAIHALAQEGYLSEDSNALHYVKLPGGDVLPYEIFRADWQDHPNKVLPPVLLLWLADDALPRKGLLLQLSSIVGELSSAHTEPSLAPPRLRVIGPASSQAYRDMLVHSDPPDGDHKWGNLAGARIYSCKASASETDLAVGMDWRRVFPETAKTAALTDWLFGQSVKWPPKTADALNRKLVQNKAADFRLVRTIAPDDQLAELMWKELDQRGFAASDRVAAIAELDKLYGRTMVSAFNAKGPGARPAGGNPLVLTYRYMTGLDGALPKNALGAEGTSAKDADSGGKLPPAAQEPTEGAGQVDYLRRLADRLTRERRNLHDRGQELRAVAVLGSDIYDKLQILRTLRSSLPDALFLTNNLDARFGHPAEWDETRNLIVAANYGLVPEQSWHSSAPPFRDSSQAAVYAAVTLALRNPKAYQGDNLAYLGRPRLFEIGHDGPIGLRPPQDQLARFPFDDSTLPKQGEPKGTVPPRYDLESAWCCLFFVACLAWLLWPKVNPEAASPCPSSSAPDQLTGWAARRAAILRGVEGTCSFLSHSGLAVPAVIVFSFAVTVWRYKAQAEGVSEPFAFWQGISIWPGDFLRLCTLLLAVHFAAKIVTALKKNARDLEERFALTHLPFELGPIYARAGAWPRRWWRNFWPQNEDFSNSVPAPENQQVNVRRWWRRYKAWTAPEKRFARAAILVCFYFTALRFFLLAIHGPAVNLPMRGPGRDFSHLLLWLTVVSVVYVTFLVVDATEINWRSIHALNRYPTDWQLRGSGERFRNFRFKDHRTHLDEKDCADYLDIELIASRSDVVNNLVYYPFILITLLLVARLSGTDNYQWSPGFLFGMGFNIGWAVYCAIRLPVEANEARKRSLKRLRRKLFGQRVVEDRERDRPKPVQSSAAALEQVVQQIETMNRGAFVGIWEQPILRAILLPSSGVGIGALLKFIP